MKEDTADRALDFVFRSPSPDIKIEFQGGEPLLNFPMVQYIVEGAKRRNITAKRRLEFVIATNLAVVTSEMLDFCREHSILISTSLDGPEDLHNKNRPRPGRDSYQRTIEGIERARAALGKDRVSALMTTTLASLDRVRDIIDEYVARDFTGIFLRPLSPYGFAVKTKWYAAYDTDRWLQFYFDGLDYVLNSIALVFVSRNTMPARFSQKCSHRFSPATLTYSAPLRLAWGRSSITTMETSTLLTKPGCSRK